MRRLDTAARDWKAGVRREAHEAIGTRPSDSLVGVGWNACFSLDEQQCSGRRRVGRHSAWPPPPAGVLGG
jgi:hypothetical protein